MFSLSGTLFVLYTAALRRKNYFKSNRAKVYEGFAKTADKSVTAECFPQIWVMYERRKDELQLSIAGFYQLDEQDGLNVHTSLTPFITTLFVDPDFRNTRPFPGKTGRGLVICPKKPSFC